MKEFKHDDDWFDPLGDKMASVVVILLTITILFVAIVTTKFVYEGGGICGGAANYLAQGGSILTITECYTTGVISGLGTGGICGGYANWVAGEIDLESVLISSEVSIELPIYKHMIFQIDAIDLKCLYILNFE